MTTTTPPTHADRPPSGWSPMGWLPNQHGFRFEALDRAGVIYRSVVVRRRDGLYTVRGGRRVYRQLVGWRPLPENAASDTHTTHTAPAGTLLARAEGATMTHTDTPTLLAAVPAQVQGLIRLHLHVLHEVTQGIAQARAMERLAGAPGRYEYDYRYGLEGAQARLEASRARLTQLQALAEAQGLDWAALCRALGGYVTPPAVGPAVDAWRPRAGPSALEA